MCGASIEVPTTQPLFVSSLFVLVIGDTLTVLRLQNILSTPSVLRIVKVLHNDSYYVFLARNEICRRQQVLKLNGSIFPNCYPMYDPEQIKERLNLADLHRISSASDKPFQNRVLKKNCLPISPLDSTKGTETDIVVVIYCYNGWFRTSGARLIGHLNRLWTYDQMTVAVVNFATIKLNSMASSYRTQLCRSSLTHGDRHIHPTQYQCNSGGTRSWRTNLHVPIGGVDRAGVRLLQ
jgi:hypothetical protein